MFVSEELLVYRSFKNIQHEPLQKFECNSNCFTVSNTASTHDKSAVTDLCCTDSSTITWRWSCTLSQREHPIVKKLKKKYSLISLKLACIVRPEIFQPRSSLLLISRRSRKTASAAKPRPRRHQLQEAILLWESAGFNIHTSLLLHLLLLVILTVNLLYIYMISLPFIIVW